MDKKIVSIIIVAVIFVGVSFYGGMKYGQNKKVAGFGNFTNSGAMRGTNGSYLNGEIGQRQFRNFGVGGGMVNGEVISKNDTGFTLKMKDGGSKIILFSNNIPVTKSVIGTSVDIVVGSEVMIVGKTNTDGSFIAESLQIRPKALDLQRTL